MYSLRFMLLLIILLPSPVLAAIDYQLDINLLPNEHRLAATATISIPTTVADRSRLALAESCSVETVQQDGKNLPYNFSAGKLSFQARPGTPVLIHYSGVFNDPVPQAPVHSEDPSYGVSASISPLGTYLSSAVGWYPQLTAKQIHYRISVHAPQGTVAITSGKRVLQQTTTAQSLSVWEIDYPLGGITLTAGHYQLFEDLNGAVPIYAYFYPESAPLAATYLKEARNYLQLYEGLFGSYPFHKFAIVENFFPTGYGLPSWTLLGSEVIKLPFIIKTSLGHEIAHSWWGNGVWVDFTQGNWSEGLTTYVADYLYKERGSTAEALAYRLGILRDYTSLVSAENSFPLAKFSSRRDKASQAIGYGKAAMLFHMLRQKIGDDNFWTGLKQIVRQRLFTRVGWNYFADLYSAISGQDLHPFFRQWLTGNSGPFLMLADVTSEKTKAGWKLRGKLVQQQPDYQLDVDLRLVTEKESRNLSLELTGEEKSFQFRTTSRPVSLTADPEANLFRILAPEEIPATVNAIRGSDRLLALRAGQNAPALDVQLLFLEALRKSGTSIQTAAEVPQEQLADHDLLIFGTAEGLLPEGIIESAAAERLTLPKQGVEMVNHPALL